MTTHQSQQVFMHELQTLVQQILGIDMLRLNAKEQTIREAFREGEFTNVSCIVYGLSSGDPVMIQGSGVGSMDALFNGLKRKSATDYPSLHNIHFVDYQVVDMEEGADIKAQVTTKVTVMNDRGVRFTFTHRSRSVSASGSLAVLECVEYFINAERAVLRVFDWIDDAKRRNRQDLVDAYTEKLATLIEHATYTDTIDKRKRELLIR